VLIGNKCIKPKVLDRDKQKEEQGKTLEFLREDSHDSIRLAGTGSAA